MQTLKSSREKINAQFAGHIAPSRFTQRIGSTIYTVNIISKEGNPEKLEDKILRMMRNDLKIESQSAIIKVPQADWLPGRSSV